MKKKIFGIKIKRILAAIGCILLAFVLWLVVRYGQVSDITGVGLRLF